ncbi:hypothetical protein ACRUMN_05040 [Kluyvera cryocrescens]
MKSNKTWCFSCMRI